MLIKVGDQIFNPNEIPCCIIFANREEVETIHEVMQGKLDMLNPEGDEVFFAAYPTGFFGEGDAPTEAFDKWATITPEQRAAMPVTRLNKD